MVETIIAFMRYLTVLFFGVNVAVAFAGMKFTKRNYIVVTCFAFILFVMQVVCLSTFGMITTVKIYPLLSHIPTVLFIVFYLKQSWLIAVTSVFASFLCCQPPRWIGSVLGASFDNASVNHIGYILTAMILFFCLNKYVTDSVRVLMNRSLGSCLLFGAIPAFYYVFDYGTAVYSNLIYSSSPIVVQFIPFVTSAFYFVFALFYYAETQKQAATQRDRDMLETQFKQAQIEIASLRQIQEHAATYRHDMRHHFALLQGLAAKGEIGEMKEYLKTAQSDIEAITPIRFCENETVNLLLSAFSTKAKRLKIDFAVDIKFSESLPFSDTELCSLLSNALENAIHACEKIADVQERHIRLTMFSKNTKLCIDIRNTYQTEPTFFQGLPIAQEQGHGYGTKSMAHIIERYGGVCRFLVKDGWFVFQATT